MDYKTFQDMDLSRDEVDRLTNAFKDDQFKKLFFDYVDELQDPENRRIYQREIAQLEKERGVDVTFINPEPGYVIKTSVDGEKKCFLNVCSNENVKKPISCVGLRDGARGLQWSLPHSLSPVREDVDRKGVRCDVYDIVFHPDTLHLAQNNQAFRNMLNSTACEAVESSFGVALDKKNLKFPKMQYKGAPHATVMRKPSKEGPVEHEGEEQEVFDRIYAAAAAASGSSSGKQEKKRNSKAKKAKHEEEVYGNYTRPNFLIKHRDCVDLQDFREAKDAKIHAAIPRELVLEVDLPLLKASTDITLDVTEKTVHLLSEKPAKYKLEVTLPYTVTQDAGSAKFDKDKKKLVIVLPVKRRDCSLEDSGVESDHGSMSTSPSEELTPAISVQTDFRTNSCAFLDDSLVYNVPDFTCHVFENNMAFTLNVKNVSEQTIEKLFNGENTSVHVKFTSVGASFFPAHYAFYVKLLEHTIDVENVSVEAWDNNVVLQFPFEPSDEIVSSYLVGGRETDAVKKFVEQPQILNAVLQEEPQEQPATIVDEKPATTKAIDIVGNSYSESSGDELSCSSYSPSKGRGILKRLNGRNVTRSISESSLDDMIVVSSFENCHASLDSMIPEDGEVSTSLKKTVRFSDHVSKQLYRSTASILGQKKKNQRKKSNKKRAQERRCSESEASEGEDRKDEKTSSAEQSEENSDVFELDMY